MYKYHPEFDQPTDQDKLWRYMDFTKFVLLLEKQGLFFARADKLWDSFEGSYTRKNIKLRFYDKNKNSREDFKKFYNKEKKYVLVNCWHINEYESPIMWQLYSNNNQGIALQTNFKSLKEGLDCKTDIYSGKIKYIDYNQDYINPKNIFAPFLCKRKSFDYENELRLITRYTGKSKEGDPPQIGKHLSTNLDQLIDKIYVSPSAQKWFYDLVKSIMNKYNLGKDLIKSKLAKNPLS